MPSATIYRPDGTSEPFLPADPVNGFSLEELQKAVGGYIEVIDAGPGRVAIMDEEGKLKNYRPNPDATRIIKQGLAKLGRMLGPDGNDEIAGNCIIADRELMGE